MNKFKRPFKKHYASVVARIKGFLQENDIQFIDINEVLLQKRLDIGSLKIEGDGHPTSEFYQLLAEHLWTKSISASINSQRINDSEK